MITNSPALLVPPPATAALTNELRAIRPPVEIPNGWAWLWWVLGVLAVLVLATIGLIWWLRKRAEQPPIPVIPPHVRAKQRLEAALALLHDARLFCGEVSGITRIYLDERFQFHAPDRTTEEFLVELRSTMLLALDQKESLGQFLQSCDLVKFARLEPTEAALRELHEAAVRLVDETQFDPIVASIETAKLPPPIPPAPPPLLDTTPSAPSAEMSPDGAEATPSPQATAGPAP